MPLHTKLVTPDRVLLDEDLDSLSLPTVEGEITVLPHHAPLVALLVPGIIHLAHASKKIDEIAVSGGFIQVSEKSQITILADTAERGQELDLSTIEEAKKRAQEVMQQAINKDDASFALAAAALQRELARLRVSRKHHGIKGVPTSDRPNLPPDENPN